MVIDVIMSQKNIGETEGSTNNNLTPISPQKAVSCFQKEESDKSEVGDDFVAKSKSLKPKTQPKKEFNNTLFTTTMTGCAATGATIGACVGGPVGFGVGGVVGTMVGAVAGCCVATSIWD